MEAALGSSKDYSLKQYLVLTEKLQGKAKVGFPFPCYNISHFS